jgi:choline monooxygenase
LRRTGERRGIAPICPYDPCVPVALPAVIDGDRAASLPWSAYCDASVQATERRRLLSPSAGCCYLGHDRLLPDRGHRRADGDPRIVLTKDHGVVRAVANVCTHACRPLLLDDAAVSRPWLRCRFHDWSFRPDGSLIGGSHIDFDDDTDRDAGGCSVRDRLALPTFGVHSWHGFHFAAPAPRRNELADDLARIETALDAREVGDWLDFDGWSIVESHEDTYRGDWKVFLEVFGDCYHVPPYHPGLASFVDCDTLEWVFGESAHVQIVERSARRGDASPLYTAWADGIEHYHALRGEPVPDVAVAWIALYPNLMIELYDGLRVISSVVATGPDTYVNRVHHLVPDDMEVLVPGLPAAITRAYEETADEDRVLVESRHDGMQTAVSLGLTIDPYHVNRTGPAPEAGVEHFHRWWTRRMAAHASPG